MKSITSIYLLGDKNKGKIGRIKEISNEITFYWNKIKEENVIPKIAKRNYDLKELLQKIEILSEERTLLKLYMQCINMGYKKFTELSKDNNQYCKISVFMPNAGSINESVISVTNVGGDSFSVAVSMIRWNANKVFCKLINGTKISNINMYYTVDTERFCFYIKANWYAKIIVSRLGLVNTSKIESINAIPSGAIEVPIS